MNVLCVHAHVSVLVYYVCFSQCVHKLGKPPLGWLSKLLDRKHLPHTSTFHYHHTQDDIQDVTLKHHQCKLPHVQREYMKIMATSLEPPPSHITRTTTYTYTNIQLPPQTTTTQCKLLKCKWSICASSWKYTMG